MKKKAIIIGAGPAGLTAALELISRGDVSPVILEKTADIGGISKTINHNGNRMDIGGHRFFSKNDRVNRFWFDILPNDMLTRKRLSRILYLRRLFDYPIALNINTIKNLGLMRMSKIGISYLKAMLFPIKNEKSLEDFYINRFGTELYNTFFKNYTKKVWGVECSKMGKDWGAQRVKGLSVMKTLLHAINPSKKNTETSLIEEFLYPKYGPGQMWERVAELIVEKGGSVIMNADISDIHLYNRNVKTVTYSANGDEYILDCDYLISSMPVKDLVALISPAVPPKVANVAAGLVYRDFITVGLLVRRLLLDSPKDDWIYIQENDVKVGRLQIFNNWSPYMVKDSDTYFIGLEYFCNEGDAMWSSDDEQIYKTAVREMRKLRLIAKGDVLDYTVVRMPKAYPAYFGTYDKFEIIRNYVDNIGNMFLVGRNGQHRYNNMDHSMLTAMYAADNILAGDTKKDNVWGVNTEDDYHESK